LSLGSGSAELVIQHGLDPAHLRHLNIGGGAAPEALGALAGEIRRMVASIPTNGTPMTLALWSSGEENPQKILEQRLSMPVTMPQLSTLVSTTASGANGYAPAVAVALLAFEKEGLPVDFLNSRLAPPKEPAISAAKLTAIIAGVLIVGLSAWAFSDYGNVAKQRDVVQAQVTKMKPDVTKAQAELKRFDDADKWIPATPHFVRVLRDVTTTFPQQGNTVWATELTNERGDSDKWTLKGQTTSDAQVRSLRDKMAADHRFAKVQIGNIAVLAGNNQQDLRTFTLNFEYKGTE